MPVRHAADDLQARVRGDEAAGTRCPPVAQARRADLRIRGNVEPRRGHQLAGNGLVTGSEADHAVELGAFYREDLVANGVATNLTHTKPAPGQTGSCMVMVTPDAERSIHTLGGRLERLVDRPHARHPRQ